MLRLRARSLLLVVLLTGSSCMTLTGTDPGQYTKEQQGPPLLMDALIGGWALGLANVWLIPVGFFGLAVGDRWLAKALHGPPGGEAEGASR